MSLNRGVRLDTFVEFSESGWLEEARSDSGLESIKRQLRGMRAEGFGTALHTHRSVTEQLTSKGPETLTTRSTSSARFPGRESWRSSSRGSGTFGVSSGTPSVMPVYFRAGSSLIQPTQLLATVLATQGIRIDSSVFRGSLATA